MKTFWAFVALLVVAAVAAWMWSGQAAPADSSSQTAREPPRPVVQPPAPAPVAAADPITAASADGDPLVELEKAAATPVVPIAAPAPPQPSTVPPAAGAAPAADLTPVELPENPAFPADKIVPARVQKRPDGALVFDERFVVRGSGSKDDPYRVTWDQIVSAQEVYNPRLGQRRMPQRVTFLHDAYVRITGFIAFPIASNNPRELLAMLNQWDGCCIGVPPTAYDAVEVRLAKVANDDERLTYHGSVEGKFKVDPYEDSGWLIGLYLMEDAILKPSDP